MTLNDVRDAAERIATIARLTPVVPAAEGSGGPDLLLKCENLQRGGAFKIRGAANMILRLPDDGRRRGVITYSSGNHGIAVSLAAQLAGIPAIVVMPTTAPAVKAEVARRLGAEIVFEGTTTVERKARAELEAAARGLTIVPPFDHRWIIAGQGTIGLEVFAQAPEAAAVYVPVSGGGLVSGIATALKALSPAVRVIGVEPAAVPRMARSLAAGGPTTVPASSGLADGLLAVRPGDATFAHVRAYVDEIVTVSDEAIARAVSWVFERARLVAEPSGAASVAAALGWAEPAWSRPGAGPALPSPGPKVAVVSGGNVEADTFIRCIRQ
ncbi:MAG TPA: threonine/serine dehydratase [Vicinamibacterales bacterium]|nr:threonine/serine dehydratase [Vicinamibacterales bacterium]HPW21196.1 threonine/serine dehydratase [Vicinamibacterales bacterium]